MPENKKEKVVEKQQTTSTPTSEKKKSNTLLYIIICIVVFLIVLGIVAFLIVRGLIKKGVDSLEEGVEQYEQTWEESDFEIMEDDEGEDTLLYKKSTEETVEGDLEKENLVTDRFPEDIPLSGGVVTSSSYDSYAIEVKIDIDSTPDEIMDWYQEALEEEGWEITSRSSEEPMEGWVSGSIEFAKEDEERRGKIDIEKNPYQAVTSVRIRELLY